MAPMPDEPTARPIDLPARLTISEITEWHQSILDTVATAPALAIEAGRVERIDTAGLQCLASLALSSRTRGQSVYWSSVSSEIMSGARRLGLVTALDLPAAEPTEENR